MQPPPFHRAYRHIELPAATVARHLLAALAPVVVLLALAEPLIRGHAHVVTALLIWAGVPVSERSVSLGHITFTVPGLASPLQPDALYAATLAVVGLVVGMVALLMRTRLTPFRVLTGIAALVCSTSGFFFWFQPDRFPYSAADFAGAWCQAEFVVWLGIPILYAVILAPLPLSAGETLLFSAQTVLYAIWFSAIRLTLLLIVFHVAGLMWMAPAYFACGFLVDFFFIVAYYSLAVARAARRLQSNRQLWRW